jgi:hypothetical protein
VGTHLFLDGLLWPYGKVAMELWPIPTEIAAAITVKVAIPKCINAPITSIQCPSPCKPIARYVKESVVNTKACKNPSKIPKKIVIRKLIPDMRPMIPNIALLLKLPK